MNKTTYKRIKWLTESEWSQDVRDVFGNFQPSLLIETGYYTPSQANWSYIVGIVALDGKLYEVVTRFGSVEGGRELQFEHNNEWNTTRKMEA